MLQILFKGFLTCKFFVRIDSSRFLILVFTKKHTNFFLGFCGCAQKLMEFFCSHFVQRGLGGHSSSVLNKKAGKEFEGNSAKMRKLKCDRRMGHVEWGNWNESMGMGQ